MPEIQQEKQLHELLSRSMVDIYVGTDNTHWVLHEKLLCHHSPYFRRIFYSKTNSTKTYGLPDEEDLTFKTFVGWLYSSSLPVPREEADLGNLFDLYLMGEKFQIPALIQDVLQVVREWYKYSESYPGLRRVQYIYANTEEGSPMRHMLVHSVARLMVLEKGIPQHWDKALRKNGQLAVDIIRAIQDWRLDEEVVPDAREEPELAEDLVEEEVQEAERENEKAVPHDDGDEGADADAEDTADVDDTDDTVVESPQPASKATDAAKAGKKKGDDLVNGVGKLGLKQMPNGITNGDYGTLQH
ncbi:hypothetical protein K491DRAFT_629636 [Lophiostoma macrostomum CBS 122681]|uniref:BTB domain-containing protein n=1 Tax=Lophiostoma macrostomum CBS 122681 TaxID=1314788 RepID=A0A6A6T785_9PLEO|nr:hypothetical protein K491DRAFT_629636 [Lophiostoma macrostomum CBS 122681]